MACAAALDNIEIIERDGILDHVRTAGPYLQESARSLLNLPVAGDVRGSHMMLGIDLVAGKASKAPLDMSEQAAGSVFQSCAERGVIVRPVGGRIILPPPLIISKGQCDELTGTVAGSIQDFFASQE